MSNIENIESIQKCSCGAYTITIRDVNYSMKPVTLRQVFRVTKVPRFSKKIRLPDSYCCDWCVNHWGVDLCACGSGKPIDTCNNNTIVCGNPSQVIGSHNHVSAGGAWV